MRKLAALLFLFCAVAVAQRPVYPGGGGGGGGSYPGCTADGSNGITCTGNVTTPNSVTSATPNLDVRTFGCKLDGTTDDTTCLQNAVNACFSQSGSLYIPSVSGKLHLAGAINAACDALICAPSVLSSAASQQCEIYGNIENNWVGTTLNSSGVIQTAVSAGTDTNSAIIGVPTVGGNFGSFDNVVLKVHDLTMLTYANPSIGGINCASAGECLINNFTYTNGESYSGTRTQPTNDRTGVILPLINNWNKAVLHDSTIFGIYTGYKISEHADVEDVNVQSGIQGVVTTHGYHAAHLRNVTFAEVVTPIVATTGILPVQIDQLDLELDSTHLLCSWCYGTIDVSDASNFLRGNVTYASVTAGAGTLNALRVTGAANIFYSVLSGGGASGGFVTTWPPLGQTVTQPTNTQFKISGSAASFASPFLLFDTTQVTNTFASGAAFTCSGATAGADCDTSFGVTLNSTHNSGNIAFHYTGAGNSGNYLKLGLFGDPVALAAFGTGDVSIGAATDNGVDALQVTGSVKATKLLQGSNTQKLTADSASITATTAATGTVVFTWGALPVSSNFTFRCSGTYTQATAAGGVSVAVQGANNAPTKLDAWATLYSTNPASTTITGTMAGTFALASTTATLVAAVTPGGTATQFQWELNGAIQVGASASTLNIIFFSGSASDAVVIKEGSYCTLNP